MTDAVSTAVSAAPLIAFVQPIVVAAVTAALGALGSRLVWLIGKYLHVQIAQADVDTVISKAQTVAGQIIAADAANLAGKSVTVANPTVAAAAASIEAKLPSVLSAAGWDQDRIAKLIVGEIGKLQALTIVASAATPGAAQTPASSAATASPAATALSTAAP